MRSLFEIMRILLIVFFLGGLMWLVTNGFYTLLGFELNLDSNVYIVLIWIAILLLIFVFYRNKLQFSGWYKGENKKKLPKSVTLSLISLSVLLLIITPFIC
jgi:accessory gene regulator protein AgrB